VGLYIGGAKALSFVTTTKPEIKKAQEEFLKEPGGSEFSED